MKKTLVALSVLLAATSAQAIELYNQDGVTVDIHGDIEVTYQNSFDHSSMKQQIEDADFGFDVRYALNDDLQFGGYWEFDGSNSNNAKDTKNGDTYVALYSKTYGSIKFGRLCTAVDDLGGITTDYQFDVNKLYEGASGDYACRDEGIRYDYDNGAFYTTLGFVQNKMDDADHVGTDADYFDGRFGYRVADLDMSVFYANLNTANVRDTEGNLVDEDAFGFEANYTGFESFRVGLGYYATNKDFDGADTNVYTLGADYYLGKWTFGSAVSVADHDEDAFDATNWFVNAGYALAPNTTAYAEVAGQDIDGNDDSDTALAIGVKASF
ncbi:porin [Vibrio renipiscarius]|uniref:Porin n=1 Tax=Vibrio renipiscarius TaxID=1461322 RepID=A0A0C2JVL8_9VIBR|nr:porin [Vibrio renipiscarius]KII75546.1 porin [Vibrio renipiscarius]KII82004.1 porin [Vibrio renipiscarius]